MNRFLMPSIFMCSWLMMLDLESSKLHKPKSSSAMLFLFVTQLSLFMFNFFLFFELLYCFTFSSPVIHPRPPYDRMLLRDQASYQALKPLQWQAQKLFNFDRKRESTEWEHFCFIMMLMINYCLWISIQVNEFWWSHSWSFCSDNCKCHSYQYISINHTLVANYVI